MILDLRSGYSSGILNRPQAQYSFMPVKISSSVGTYTYLPDYTYTNHKQKE